MKLLCKLVIEDSSHPFTDMEREMLERAVDSSSDWEQQLSAVIAALRMG